MPGQDGDAELHVQDPVEGEVVVQENASPDAIAAEIEGAAEGDARQRRAEVQKLLSTEKTGRGAKKEKEELRGEIDALHARIGDMEVDWAQSENRKNELEAEAQELWDTKEDLEKQRSEVGS